jgi:hypothetical protein
MPDEPNNFSTGVPDPLASNKTPIMTENVNIGDALAQSALAAINSKPDIESWANQKWAFAKARIELCIKLGDQAFLYRGILFYFLLVLMTVETLFLFFIVFETAGPKPKLEIPNTTLQIIVGATIVQISTMVIVIIQSVFPKDMKQLIDVSKEIADLK